MPIMTIIADDNAFFRKTLRKFVEGLQDITVAAEAGNGLKAVELVEDLRPAVVLMDVNMPEINGLEACRMIKKAHPEIRVVLYTMDDPEIFAHLPATGADECLSKDRLFDELPAILLKSGHKPNHV